MSDAGLVTEYVYALSKMYMAAKGTAQSTALVMWSSKTSSLFSAASLFSTAISEPFELVCPLCLCCASYAALCLLCCTMLITLCHADCVALCYCADDADYAAVC